MATSRKRIRQLETDIALDSVNCMLYESFATTWLEVGFEVANTAIWNLSLGDLQRPAGWTSACAVGEQPSTLACSSTQR